MEGRLFSPFERLGAAGSPIEGTGLGLAVSRKLCEAMGCTIGFSRVRSGKGSIFFILLPKAEPPIHAAAIDKDKAVVPSLALSGSRTVLYIEDNLSNVELIEELLSKYPNVKLLVAMQG